MGLPGIGIALHLLLFSLLLFPGFASAGVDTEVVLNKSVLITLPKPCARVSIAAPAIARLVDISPTQLQIIGLRIGSTDLIVWDKGGESSFYDIRVKGDITLLEKQIRATAPKDRITVEYAEETILLAGTAANDQTVEKVVQIATAYAIREGAAFGAGNESALLPPGEATGRRAGADSKVKIINQIAVEQPQQVLLEVKVAQVDKNALKSLGISMLVKGAGGEGFTNMVGAPDSGPTAGSKDGSQNSIPGIAGNIPWMGAISPLAGYQLGGALYKSGLGGVLRALATKDLAKILAEPNLLVKSGQEGTFLAGSKIPIQVVTGVGAISGTTIEFINVGVKLNVKPVVMENGLISLKINPAEVSNVTGTLAVNGYPIIDTREIRTEVELKGGESLILGGLLMKESIKTTSKIPILGDIPYLGALFRSIQDDDKEKELVFFITPKIVMANSVGEEPELPTDAPLTPEQEKDFQWIPTL